MFTGTRKEPPRWFMLKGSDIITQEKREKLLTIKERLREEQEKDDGDGWGTYPRINLHFNLKKLSVWNRVG